MRLRSQLAAGACAAFAIGVLGCGARPHDVPPALASDLVTLYRDRAVVRQRVELAIPSAGRHTIPVRVAAGVDPSELVVLGGDRAGVVVAEVRRAHASPAAPSEDPHGLARDEAAAGATELELVLDAARAGRFVVALEYATDRLTWGAAYTLTTTPARERAVLRGAVAIRNDGGVRLHARSFLVDGEHGELRDLRPRLELGVLALGHGETRVELPCGSARRTLRPVLVYDPIGPGLDQPGATPVSDPSFGASPHVSTRITESVELERDERSRGLPAGPLRLVERRASDALVVLGSSRLGDAATRAAAVDTVALGPAVGVVGHRVRRDWAADPARRRFTEEILITLASARARPVDVVIREHLYRGRRWTLAYHSTPAVKEGPQQIALRARVPANGLVKVLYVVVYTW